MAETTSIVGGNLLVRGQLVPQGGMVIPAASIGNTQVGTTDPIAADKLQHQLQPCYVTGSATTAAAATQAVHVVRGVSGTLVGFDLGSIVANIGDSTVTVDLKRNGTSLLTAAVTLTSAHAAREVVAATLLTTALAADDVLEVVVTVSAGTGTLAKGVFARVTLREDAE